MSESTHDPKFLVKGMMGAKVEVLVGTGGLSDKSKEPSWLRLIKESKNAIWPSVSNSRVNLIAAIKLMWSVMVSSSILSWRQIVKVSFTYHSQSLGRASAVSNASCSKCSI